ncbi:ATP-binding protein [Ectobacillus funiculus]|uniref:ATP-binding protein n=1 Tax=Ectobacillus funiculus TaxID=137993 RepID=UPI001FE69E95|nr:ATP-binding protein [Ectobacillus funiculus]
MIQEGSKQMFAILDEMQRAVTMYEPYEITTSEPLELKYKNLCFFKLCSLTYDDKLPYREAIENILSTLENEYFNFVYLLSGDLTGITIYLGIVKNCDLATDFSVAKYGRKLEAAFNGYFQGSILEKLVAEQVEKEIIEPLQHVRRISVITGIPSIHESSASKNLDFQGIDRLINSMSNETWKLLIIAERVKQEHVVNLQNELYNLYDFLHLQSKQSIQVSSNMSEGESTSQTKGKSQSKSKGANESKAFNENKSTSSGSSSNNTSKSTGNTTTRSTSDNQTTGTNSSETSGTNKSMGKSETMTIDIVNKRVQEVLKYIDEVQFGRLKLGITKGLFKTAMYILGENLDQHDRLKSNVLAIFQGDQPTMSPLRVNEIKMANGQVLADVISSFQLLRFPTKFQPSTALLHGTPQLANEMELATYMTSKELSLVAAMPQKEITGLALKEGVDFGLNVIPKLEHENPIELGYLMKRGHKQPAIPISLTKSQINKHIFIGGVTGSGKTTTCQKLLIQSEMPFIVIEPAKTEYRSMIDMRGMEDVIVFTLGNEKYSPFRLNPFELLEGEGITSHIDMLKATFTAAFPMEAAMPQILEEAMYECYKQCGWNIEDDTNNYCNNPWAANGEYFPTLTMLVEQLSEVVNKKGFGNELRENYIGSLVSRMSNLTIGSKGLMLDCHLSVDFNNLLDKKVIIEMEDIKSQEDKSLMMGLILARIGETVKRKYKANRNYKHITLVEEAHRLLSKVDYGDSSAKKAAVETFSDMLAEVRKYGEGLIIVDQIPNKLASEVLKNTNTKIIHCIFARDDKEVIGDTMLMNDRQKEFLSNLNVGEAILFTAGLHKPVHIAIERMTDTSENGVEDERLKEIGMLQKQLFFKTFYPMLSILELPLKGTEQAKTVYSIYKNIVARATSITQQEWDRFVDQLEDFGNSYDKAPVQLWKNLCLFHSIQTHHFHCNRCDKSAILKAADDCYRQFSLNIEEVNPSSFEYTLIFG